jgi:FtsP/CotA-like multicopper oxidase with cupredoxin domain
MTVRWNLRRSERLAVASAMSLALVTPLGWMWAQSLVPETYSVMDMGYLDYGGGPEFGAHSASTRLLSSAHGVSVTELTGPRDRAPDVEVTLVARRQRVTLNSGESIEGYTLNGTSPGPTLRVNQGELLRVTLVNESVSDGVTLHWHGVDLPNAEDGVAGVTQDAVEIGNRHTYQFLAEDAGTYWYHSHQVSHVQVRDGLFGVLLVQRPGDSQELDLVTPVHTYRNHRTASGSTGIRRITVGPGTAVRVRLVNTDNGPLDTLIVGSTYRVLAVDARDIVAPTPVSGMAIQIPAGGRADLGFTTPADGSAVRVQLGVGTALALVVGPADALSPDAVDAASDLDLLSYGSPASLGFDPSRADRVFTYSIGRRPGFIDGVPGMHWSINGHLYPDVPMFVVAYGDVVRMRISNHSGELHPIHLHGHHAVVLSRNGLPATGSPWWIDSLDVANGDSYDIAFLADNPGIWMDHCHNLKHAVEGLIAHVMYVGVTTPFLIGGPTGNIPE